MPTSAIEEHKDKRQDGRQRRLLSGDVMPIWAAGMVFIVVLLAAIFGFGHVRQWDANSGYTHYQSATSQDRFLPEPKPPEPGVPERSDSQASTRWYYWQLPPAQATVWTRLSTWLCYIGHQLTIWGTIYYAQKEKTRGDLSSGPKYTNSMSVINVVPFILNVIFHIFHLAQTHLTYDGLAQDVTESSSQGSVVMMLILMLVMEYRDRGLFFGWPAPQHTGTVSRKLRLSQGAVNLVRKYHGYAFSWAVIYTFWYHPMENTWGHALGFFHTWMIMLQGSLMYTNVHVNRIWRLVLESWVTLHAVIVAMQTAGPELNGTLLWPMFLFGFLWMFTVTQLFGLQFWKKLPWWTRGIPFLVYLGVCVWCFSWIPDKNGVYFVRLHEVLRIPAIEYGAFIFAWGFITLLIRVRTKLTSTDNSDTKTPFTTLSTFQETLYIGAFMLIYALMIITNFLVQEFDWKLNLIPIMLILIFLVFIPGASLGFMVIESRMRKRRSR